MVSDYLFKENQLRIPKGSLRLFVIEELHGGELGGHFGRVKTKAIVKQRYFWLTLKRCVACFVQRLYYYCCVSILKYLVHWQGKPNSEDAWISNEELKKLDQMF